MSIRANTNTKDRKKKGSNRNVANADIVVPTERNALQFWTAHPDKPCFVDLTSFEIGKFSKNGSGVGSYTGRPGLIEELAPAIVDHLSPLAAKSVDQHLNAIRAWWRLFDAVEGKAPDLPKLTSVSQLTELHRQRAYDQGMDRLIFGNFLIVVNKTRAALGLKPLYWQRPRPRTPTRHLPPQWQTDLVRHKLKHAWLATVDRWDTAEALLVKRKPLVSKMDDAAMYAEQSRLLKSYRRLETTIKRTGDARPTVEALFGKNSKDDFYDEFKQGEMLRSRYPDSQDIRVAFHLCLAITGWNPATLIDLDVDDEFVEPHPKDPSRYILRARKDRARGKEQVYEGLIKTRFGPGFILRRLIAQTAPLRKKLKSTLDELLLEQQHAHEPTKESRIALEKRIDTLKKSIRSPWLYFTGSGNEDGITSLADVSYARHDFLEKFIAEVNQHQAPDRQVEVFKATDFRDAYAARVYHASGGSILAVMKALNHSRLSSTQDYLNNTLLREEHRVLYSTFSNSLWHDIRVNRRVDPTVLAAWSRHGAVSPQNEERLALYRKLLRSRIGTGCKDPHNPPKHIAPNFVADGKKMCSVHRCMLCLEKAVLFPDSLQGLCKRLAELRYLRANMSVISFSQSSFGEEMENIELALLGFDPWLANETVRDWERKIAEGSHRVVEFDGAEE
ncbi:hypothetical protein [Paraburkholderia sp. RL17-337-BIB-A]|uniref:hypothetical protein n=1 Tax=Paraburkholderia sp. RL17-337-BIB-A TaxID=3031636 RepID=UPI0038BAA8A8